MPICVSFLEDILLANADTLQADSYRLLIDPYQFLLIDSDHEKSSSTNQQEPFAALPQDSLHISYRLSTESLFLYYIIIPF